MTAGHRTTLKQLMDEREILAKALANAVGTDASTVSRWRNGLTPNAEMRGRISEALTLEESDLIALGWQDKETADV